MKEALNKFAKVTKKQAKKGIKAGTELAVAVIGDPFTLEHSKSKNGLNFISL